MICCYFIGNSNIVRSYEPTLKNKIIVKNIKLNKNLIIYLNRSFRINVASPSLESPFTFMDPV